MTLLSLFDLKGHDFKTCSKRSRTDADNAAMCDLKGHDFDLSRANNATMSDLKGHDFSRAAKADRVNWALAPEGRFSRSLPGMEPIRATKKLHLSGFVTGHDFSRADKADKISWALAPAEARRANLLKVSPLLAPRLAPAGCSFFQPLLSIALLLALCLAIFAPALSPAQQAKPWEKISIPKLHDFKPQQPKRIVLKNGIVLFLQEDHELPFVSGSVLIPGGSRDEDPSKTGLVELYGQAWRTSGTAKVSGDALDDLLEAKAAHIETEGGGESTMLAWDSLKADADQVFTLASDLLLHPAFNPEKLQLAQQQAATGIVRRNDEESEIASRESAKLVYGTNSPYTHQPELATIGAVTIDDLKAWHDRTIGGKLIVGISGDFDPVTMEAKLRAAFESLPPVKAAPPRHDTFPGPKPGISFIDKEDVNQSNVEIVGLGTDRRNPDVPALALMNDVLGGGFSSRLIQKVRTELGLAYSVGGGYGFAYDHPATFRVAVLTGSATTVEATKAALDVIVGLTSREFTQEELGRAKDNILNSFLFRYDTKDKVLSESERLEFYGYPANYLETYQAALKKVSLADLNAVAKKYIHPEKLALLVVGNGPEIKPGLDELKLGPIQTVDITIPQPGKQQGQPAAMEKKQ